MSKIEIHHLFNKEDKEIYTAMHLDGQLLIDWTPKFTEINSNNPDVYQAVHKNIKYDE